MARYKITKNKQMLKIKEYIKKRTGVGKEKNPSVTKSQVYKIVRGNKRDFQDNFKELEEDGIIYKSLFSPDKYRWLG